MTPIKLFTMTTLYDEANPEKGRIVAGAKATLSQCVDAGRRITPQTIRVSVDIASKFSILGIYAGVEPLLALHSHISAMVFCEDSITPPFKAVWMNPGEDFSIQVANLSIEPAHFTAEVWGLRA